MNELRELKLNRIAKKINLLVYKDNNNITITEKELKEFKALEEELKSLGYEHLGNGLIADLLEE